MRIHPEDVLSRPSEAMQEFSTDTRKIWTVSELNQSARELLEEHFPRVWVEGEISNFRLYPSGHAYFSLKDDSGQITAAMFRFSTRGVKFEAGDGLAVIARGQLTVYERRGQYQLVVEGLEPKGKGALQLAFEQLRDRLREEGLFDEERKKALPLLPRKVGVVTSAAGAAVRDIIDVLTRRFPSIEILLNPVRVQGETAAGEIAAAIGEMNAREDIDVLIVGRGGGSIEDLWAFNEEAVARAVAASRIPVVSAVGHETDFTIADFVADVRAPTPSAAAELVVRSRESLEGEVRSLARALSNALRRRVENARHRLESMAVERMVSDKRRRLREMAQVTDDFHRDLCRVMEGILAAAGHRLAGLREALSHLSPRARQAVFRERLRNVLAMLEGAADRRLQSGRERSRSLAAQLEALSPLAVLGRGYSICRLRPGLEVVRDAGAVAQGDDVSIRLHRGELQCRVVGTSRPEEEAAVEN
jgi:exodeoxyribonuclease VII large subunit